MKSFNFATLAAILLVTACTFISCKKDKDVAAPESMLSGAWEGKYGFGNAEPAFYFALEIKNDGTLQVKSGDKENPDITPGTWTLQDDVFKAVYQQQGDEDALNLAAKLDDSKKKLTGSWGHGKENADTGDFVVTKK